MSSTPDCVIAVVHGIGVQDRGVVVNQFQKNLLAFLNQRLGGQARVSTRPAPMNSHLDRGHDLVMATEPEGRATATIRLRELNWADLDGRISPTPGGFLRLLGWLVKALFTADYGQWLKGQPSFGARLARLLRAGVLFGVLLLAALFGLLASLLVFPFGGRYNTIARFAGVIMEYLGDVWELRDSEVRKAINQRMNRQLAEIMALDRPRFLVVVSHSLGNVFVLDQFRRQLQEPPVPMGWVSLGSPLWIIPLIDKDYPHAREVDLNLKLGWANLYDPLDPVGGPMENRALTNPDKQWYRSRCQPITAHLNYFRDQWHMASLWAMVATGLENRWRVARHLPRAPKNRRRLRLGPFLRHSTPNRLAIWTAHTHGGIHRMELSRDGELVQSIEQTLTADNGFTALWVVEGLEPDSEYQACFYWLDEQGHAWRLTQPNQQCQSLRQTPVSWTFRTPPEPGGELRLLFTSCNHPRHVYWDGDQGFSFIKKLYQRLKLRPPHLHLLMGDQVYADDWWQDQLLLPWPGDADRRGARLETYHQVYDHFWWAPEWGDLLRLCPSLMMWDDHDIRDGWGSNVHDYKDGELLPEAREKMEAAAACFDMYQTCGNPPAASDLDRQFSLRVGPVAIFEFDTRTHRDYKKADEAHPFGRDQLERYWTWVRGLDDSCRVAIVVTSSPAVFIKRWRLDLVALELEPLNRWMERFLHASGADDDFRDQLPSYLNYRARDAVLAGLDGFLAARPPGERKALWVAGDVHVGGYCRIDLGGGRHVDQWIGSPSTNRPNRLLQVAAAWALPRRAAGRGPNGEAYRARDFKTKAARNAVLVTISPPAGGDGPPVVRGELIYESRSGLGALRRRTH